MSVQHLLPTYDYGKRPRRLETRIKYAHAGTMSIQQKAVDIRHMKYAHAGRVSNCPTSAETSMYGHAHAFSAFPVQTVHLVVDSGELGQPDDASCLEGMAGRRTCDDAHVGCKMTQRVLPT